MNKDFFIQLTTNLYRLTLLFPKKEPLRYKMRELADEILANLLRITNLYEYTNKSHLSKKTENCSLQLLQDLKILDSFFEVAKAQNWVSIYDVLEIQKEYSRIREELEGFNKTETVEKEECSKLEVGTETSFVSFVQEKINERQQKILEILKEKGQAQAWELKKVFPEVSKRTIRRDFKEMVRRGLIERVGERNETFYRLI